MRGFLTRYPQGRARLRPSRGWRAVHGSDGASPYQLLQLLLKCKRKLQLLPLHFEPALLTNLEAKDL
jgi:hypothetical protein